MTTPSSIMDAFPTGERGHTRSYAEAWSVVSESLVRGLAHALSNRIATIGTIAELLRVGGDDPTAMSEMLAVETRRLEDLLEQMRVLSARHSGRLEAMRLSDAVAGAMAMHGYHPERRAIAVTIEPGDESRPVLGDALRLQREIVLLLDAATHAALSHASRAVRVRFGLHGRVGVVRVLVGEGAGAGALPECTPGTIALSVDESNAGLAYVLVIPALGAGA
ncbi:MAG: HAMP domain-containing histidine kinase [Gemmatimonadaceae bacterium]|nr:HAMP domain-containing histidine kinase [Gemmatimonadaceae bacterium]